jgi:hypothetical protein
MISRIVGGYASPSESALSIQASLGIQLCIFRQAGHRIGILRSASIESNTIISVVRPVETLIPKIGQRIKILGTKQL